MAKTSSPTKNSALTVEMSNFLNYASKELSSSLNYKKTLRTLAKLIVPKLADWFVIDTVNEKDEFELLLVQHVDPKKIKFGKELRKKMPLDKNATTGVPRVVKTGVAEIYPDITEEMLQAGIQNKQHLKIVQEIGFKSIMILPLNAGGKTLGAITLVTTSESNRHYSEADMKIMHDFADRVAMALENADLYKKQNDEIEVRRKYSDALHANEERLQLAQKAANICTFDWDIENNTVAWSDGFCQIYEVSPKDIPSTPIGFNRFMFPEDKQFVIDSVQKALGGEGYNIEFRVLTAKGILKWVTAQAEVYRNAERKPVRMIGIHMDVTKRKELESRRDDFIGVASHELKTPLTSIKAFTQLLESYASTKKDLTALTYISRMHTQIDRLSLLVDDLLNISKIKSGKLVFTMEQFDLNELLRMVVNELAPTTNRHELVIKGSLKEKIYGDKYRIGQVITNLITNAIKYMPQEGEITVQITPHKRFVDVAVIDHGIGIPQKDTKSIFDRFYRVEGEHRETFPGLGLGLYVSSEIINRHNGRIWVESIVGKGSTFHVELPLPQ